MTGCGTYFVQWDLFNLYILINALSTINFFPSCGAKQPTVYSNAFKKLYLSVKLNALAVLFNKHMDPKYVYLLSFCILGASCNLL